MANLIDTPSITVQYLVENAFSTKDNEVVTTSRKVAEYFGKKHSHVLRDIDSIEKQANFNGSKFGSISYIDRIGKTCREYVMNFDGFILLVMGYRGQRAMQIKLAYIDAFNRMREMLEKSNAPAVPAGLPDFTNPAIAARAYADQYERAEKNKQLALEYKEERDTAIRTKAQISRTREASAMARASVETRRRMEVESRYNALIEHIASAKDYMAVTAIPWLGEVFIKKQGMYSALGRFLSRVCSQMGVAPHKLSDQRYGSVNTYHKTVVERAYKLLSDYPDILAGYRR